jgi:glycosyltransferase involved in cell wall biosynthesis
MQAARFADVHVVTRANNEPAISKALEEIEGPHPTFHYLDLPSPLRWLKKRTGTYGLVAYYYLWQLKLWRMVRRLHRRQSFEILHHVTFANDWLPSGLALIPSTPFVWGPIGGSTHQAPPAVERTWGKTERRYEAARRLMQKSIISIDPLLRRTAQRASLTLPYTQEAAEASHLKGPLLTLRHIGIEVDPTGPPPDSDIFTIVTGGRLVHWKGQDLTIRAFAKAVERHGGNLRLLVTGNGPFRETLEQLAADLAIARFVDFVGYLPTQNDVLDLIATADLYALPTWRDGPPVAILEAMGVGTPPLCLAIGATDELVPDGCGLKVEPFPISSVEERMVEAIEWGISHRQELRQMGKQASEHVGQAHAWHAIGDTIGEVYRIVLDEGHRAIPRTHGER